MRDGTWPCGVRSVYACRLAESRLALEDLLGMRPVVRAAATAHRTAVARSSGGRPPTVDGHTPQEQTLQQRSPSGRYVQVGYQASKRWQCREQPTSGVGPKARVGREHHSNPCFARGLTTVPSMAPAGQGMRRGGICTAGSRRREGGVLGDVCCCPLRLAVRGLRGEQARICPGIPPGWKRQSLQSAAWWDGKAGSGGPWPC